MSKSVNLQADFTPTKRFFVEMLTRDIDLEDAILDLLDNCLDGVARSRKIDPDNIQYKGYWVKIKFSKDGFEISDNCGGIPIESVNYAFRMGRPTEAPKENLPTVGVYGIGMKRSIFKIGRHCVIKTKHDENDSFNVVIDEKWLSSDKDWKIKVQKTLDFGDVTGTTINITKLIPSISEKFSNKAFSTGLINKVIYAYSYILAKGFEVEINNEKINPNPITIRYESLNQNGRLIQPYIYKATIDEVDVKLIVGFNRPLPTQTEFDVDANEPKNRTEDAGWTIVCNDRIVVYRDKSELTGWGVDFARYHTQFISISGIVYFTSKNPEKLPITTTKRGIDVSSALFLKVRRQIIEGTKIFIDYTNKWKGAELIKESNTRLNKAEVANPLEIIKLFSSKPEKWVNVKNRNNEEKFTPSLPIPSFSQEDVKRIAFSKSEDQIEVVANYFSLEEFTPNQVGERCFDFIHSECIK